MSLRCSCKILSPARQAKSKLHQPRLHWLWEQRQMHPCGADHRPALYKERFKAPVKALAPLSASSPTSLIMTIIARILMLQHHHHHRRHRRRPRRPHHHHRRQHHHISSSSPPAARMSPRPACAYSASHRPIFTAWQGCPSDRLVTQIKSQSTHTLYKSALVKRMFKAIYGHSDLLSEVTIKAPRTGSRAVVLSLQSNECRSGAGHLL